MHPTPQQAQLRLLMPRSKLLLALVAKDKDRGTVVRCRLFPSSFRFPWLVSLKEGTAVVQA
jgi:hypothetical protein